MWNLKKNDRNEFTYKTEILSELDNEFMVTKGEKVEIDGEFGIDMHTLPYLK